MLRKAIHWAAGAWQVLSMHHRLMGMRLRLFLVRHRIRRIRALPEKAMKQIEAVCREAAQKQLTELLHNTSIEALSPYGGSVKILQRNGYHRMSDLIGASETGLQRLHGIGPARAETTMRAYEEVVTNLAQRVRLLPINAEEPVRDFAPLTAITKWIRLRKECEDSANQLAEQEAAILMQLKTFGLPVVDYVKSEEIREPWRGYKARLRQAHQKAEADSLSAYVRLESLQPTTPEALQCFRENQRLFRSIIDSYHFDLKA